MILIFESECRGPGKWRARVYVRDDNPRSAQVILEQDHPDRKSAHAWAEAMREKISQLGLIHPLGLLKI